MACSHLCFLIHVIKASSLPVTLLASVLYTWAGALMVRMEYVLVATCLFDQNHDHVVIAFFLSNLSCSGLSVRFAWLFNCLNGHSMYHGEVENRLHVGSFKFKLRLEVDISSLAYFIRLELDKANSFAE